MVMRVFFSVSLVLIYTNIAFCFCAVAGGVLPASVSHAMLGSNVPDLSALPHLRFLTSSDFFPFNYETSEGHMAGYNIDLAKAICNELHIMNKCQIEAVPFNQLTHSLRNFEGEAVIAGLKPESVASPASGGASSPASGASSGGAALSFSRPYMVFPARFLCLASRVNKQTREIANLPLKQQRIGVLAGTSHVAMLHIYFPEIQYILFKNIAQLQDALNRGTIDAVFGDGRILASLQGDYSFEGSAYYNERFLGSGMRIATLASRQDILTSLDYALEQVKKSGELERLYLRYFALDFYR